MFILIDAAQKPPRGLVPTRLRVGRGQLCRDTADVFLQGGKPSLGLREHLSTCHQARPGRANLSSAPLTNTSKLPTVPATRVQGRHRVAMATHDGQLFICFWVSQNPPCLCPVLQPLNRRTAGEKKAGRREPRAPGQTPKKQSSHNPPEPRTFSLPPCGLLSSFRASRQSFLKRTTNCFI